MVCPVAGLIVAIAMVCPILQKLILHYQSAGSTRRPAGAGCPLAAMLRPSPARAAGFSSAGWRASGAPPTWSPPEESHPACDPRLHPGRLGPQSCTTFRGPFAPLLMAAKTIGPSGLSKHSRIGFAGEYHLDFVVKSYRMNSLTARHPRKPIRKC